MIRRLLRYPGWEWHVLMQPGGEQQIELPSRKRSAGAGTPAVRKTDRIDEEQAASELGRLLELKRQYPECAGWADDCAGRMSNHIQVDALKDAEPVISGTLIYQASDDPSDIQPFHFWLTKKRLVTMHGDMRLPLRLQSVMHSGRYEACGIAPEAFFVMIGIILEIFHAGLDGFERRLGELEQSMRRHNRAGLIDTIFERRYDLLHWSHLFIPIRELHGAAKEAFYDELTDTDSFIRMTHKLERIELLLKHYALEIDTLISMDDALSSFRGNDIMRTLTIFTVLFLPASIAGALMGSNFTRLPWKDYPQGFAVMIAGIALITAGIYLWLWRKGWTGDLLHKRRRTEAEREPGSRASRRATRQATRRETESGRAGRKSRSLDHASHAGYTDTGHAGHAGHAELAAHPEAAAELAPLPSRSRKKSKP